MQAGPCPQRQRAGIDERAAGIGVGAIQGQRGQAVLGQRTGAAEAAVEGQVVAAQHGQAGIENEVVAQGDRAVGIERGIATHGHRAGTQRGVVAHHQATGVEADASTEGIGAGQCLHAGTVLDQSAAAADHAVVGAVGHAAQGQRVAAQRHAAAGHTGQRTDALVATAGDIQCAGTGKIHRAGGGQAAAGPDGQRAAVDGGTAGVGIGAGQGHRRRTTLDQATATADDTPQRERIAAEQVEVGTGGEVDGIAKGHRQAAVQRRIGTDVQRTAAQCRVVADHQPATVQCHAAAEQIGAAEGENARAVLDQPAGTGNRAIEGAAADATQDQGVGAQADRRAGHAGQRTDGLVGAGGRDVEARTRRRHVHCTGRRQAATGTDRQRAGVDGGAAGVGVDAGQCFDTAADLGQATGAGDRTAEGAVGGTAHFDVVGPQVDRAVAHQRAEHLRAVAGRQVQRGAGGEIDGSTCGQACAGAERQRTGIDVGTAGVGVDAVQGQRCKAVLGQAAGPGEHSVEGECVGAQHGQPGIEHNVVGQRRQRGGIQCGRATDGKCAGPQRHVIAQHQAAGIERHAAAEGVGAGQGLHTRPHLHQPAATTDQSIKRAVASAAEGQRIAAQGQRSSRHAVERTDGLAAACAGDVEGRPCSAQRDITCRRQAAARAQRKRAGIDGGATGIGVGAGQCQRRTTILDQAAIAGHDAAKGQRVAARQRQCHARSQVHGVAQRHRSAGIQRGATGHIQRTGAQRAAGANHQAATIQGQAAAKGVAVVERQQTSAVLDQAAVAAQHAAQGDVIAAAQGQLRAGTEVHRVGKVQRHRVVEADGTTHTERAGPQRIGVAQHQPAAIERQATAERVGTGQRLDAGTGLDQAAGATDHAIKGGVGIAAEGQRIAAQRQRGSGHAVQRSDGLVAAGRGNVEARSGIAERHIAARRQAATGTQRQRAVVDGGAAGIEVGTAQGQPCRAVLDQSTGAEHRPTQRQVVAAQHGEIGTCGQADAVAQVQCGAGIQRRIATHIQCARAECAGIAQPQHTGIEADTTGEGVGAIQGQRRSAVLDQFAGSGDDTAQRHVLAAQQVQHRAACQVHAIAQRERDAAVQGRVPRHIQCPRAQRAGIAQQQATGIERQAAAEGIGSIERERAGTVLDQRAGAGDHAAKGGCLIARQCQRSAAAQGDVVGQVERGQAIKRGRTIDVQCAAAQRGAVAEQQAAGIERQPAAEGIGTGQGQYRSAVLDQAAGPGHHTAQGQVLCARQGQRTGQVHRIAQVQRGGAVQRAVAADRQRAAAEGTVVAQHQPTGSQVQATTEGVGSTQCLRAGALLDQAAGTGNHACQGLVGGVAEGQRRGAERQRAAGHATECAHGLVAAGGQIQHRADATEGDSAGCGQAATGTDRHRARIDGGAAGVGVGTAQGQCCGAILHQAAAAADDTAQRQCIAAEHIERRTAAQVDAIAHAQRRTGIQRHRATDIQCTGAQRAGITQHQAAGIERQPATERIGTIERQRCRAILGQPTHATDHTVERQRLVAQQVQRSASAQRDRIGQGQRGGAIQAHVAPHTERAAAECSVVAQQQATGVERNTAAEIVDTRQRLHAGPQLDQTTRAGTERAAVAGVAQPAQGQRVAAQIDRAAEAGQRADGLVGRCRQVQRGANAQRHRTGG